jgi:hypothetical protein
MSLKATGTAPQLSLDFLTLLGKAYKLRYPDSVEPGFNLSLALTKILVEVDTPCMLYDRASISGAQTENLSTQALTIYPTTEAPSRIAT